MDARLRSWRWPGAIGIALVAALLIFTPVLAQDASDGNITLDEDVTGNQYLFGNAVTVNGDVDGDLTVFGRSLTINGTVKGDVLFAGSWLLVHGKVDGDIRGAGGILILDEDVPVSGDLVAAGYSIEMRPGSTVGGEVLAVGGQVMLESIAKDVKVGTGNLRINGPIGGDVEASVGTADQPSGTDPFIGMRGQDPAMPSAAVIPGGLSFGSDGKIKGDLHYSSTQESTIASGAVGGKTSFTHEQTSEETQQSKGFFASDTGKTAGYFVASLIVLTLLGVLLQRFRPNFLNGSASTLRRRIFASLGVGVLGYVAFFGLLVALIILIFVLVLPLSVVAMGQRFFGAITLAGLGVGTVFVVMTNWLAPLVVGLVIGEWVYGQIEKEKKSPFWSLVIGLVIVLLVISIPVVGGWLFGSLVAFFGLGAIILYLWPSKPAPAVEAPRLRAAPAA